MTRERCWDWYGDYSAGTQTNPAGAVSGSDRVVRGGGWGDEARFARSAYRGDSPPEYEYVQLGFRLARNGE